MVEAPRAECRLCEILPVVGMARSSCECARNAQAGGETEEHAAARKAVIEASGASGGTYGYRRVYAQASADAGDGAAIGEWTVRDIMRDEGLAACAAKKKRRCSSYEGEISEAPTNLLRDDRGKHHFRANKPNELWITDVTEFRIPAGKVYLSPIVGLLRRHAAELVDLHVARRRDGQLVAARRVQLARRGRPSQDPLGPRLPLPLAGMDKDMR
jgi:transposase InsO family protein